MDRLATKVATRFRQAGDATPHAVTAGREGVEWVLDNVIDQQFEGKVVRDEIDAYGRQFVVEAQRIHKFVAGAVKANAKVQGSEVATQADVVAAVLRALGRSLGDDAMAKLVARMIATGEYAF